jgi:hypothetical protein
MRRVAGRVESTECLTTRQALARRIPSLVHRFGAASFLTEAHVSSPARTAKATPIAAAIALALLTAGCALSLRNPDIIELQRHPGRYTDQTVSVSGVVTSSWGVPFVPFRFYKIDDGTGEVTVLSDDQRMPAQGEHVRVRGRVENVAMIGGRPLGLHIREESLYVKR